MAFGMSPFPLQFGSRDGGSGPGLGAILAAIGALLWHSEGSDDHLDDQDGDILT